MKNIFQTLILPCILFSYIPFFGQNASQAIVKIITEDEFGEEGEFGAGIIVGQAGGTYFIVTANHVVENAEKVKVQFNQSNLSPFPAEVDENVEPQLDVAVLKVTVPLQTVVAYAEIRKMELGFLKLRDKIKVVGHPVGNEWTVNTKNSLLNLNHQPGVLSLTTREITSGFSGGGVFDKKNRLIGMLTRVGAAETIVVKADELLRLLAGWRIPTNFILPYKYPPRKATYPLAGAGLVAIGAGVLFHIEGDDKYSYYAEYRDETSEVFYPSTGDARDTYRDKAIKNFNNRDISYIAGGVLIGTAILINLTKRKPPKKSNASNLQVYPVWNLARNKHTPNLQVGLRYRF